MAQPKEFINDKLQESIDKYFAHHNAEVNRSVRKHYGLAANQPLPASGGDYPKMVYHTDYFKAKTEQERAENTDLVNSADDEASLGENWHVSLAKAKQVAESGGVETRTAVEVKKARRK